MKHEDDVLLSLLQECRRIPPDGAARLVGLSGMTRRDRAIWTKALVERRLAIGVEPRSVVELSDSGEISEALRAGGSMTTGLTPEGVAMLKRLSRAHARSKYFAMVLEQSTKQFIAALIGGIIGGLVGYLVTSWVTGGQVVVQPPAVQSTP